MIYKLDLYYIIHIHIYVLYIIYYTTRDTRSRVTQKPGTYVENKTTKQTHFQVLSPRKNRNIRNISQPPKGCTKINRTGADQHFRLTGHDFNLNAKFTLTEQQNKSMLHKELVTLSILYCIYDLIII